MPKNPAPPTQGKSGKLNPTLANIRNKKIKKLGDLHPKSRKASKAHKDLLHMDKKVFHIATRDLKYKPELMKMSFFQRSIWMDQKKVYTLEELKELANEYTERHDDEIADAYQEAKIFGTSGVKRLAPTSRAGQYETLRLHEKELLENGKFSVPDLTNPRVVRDLSEWKSGNVDQMKSLKTIEVGLPEEQHMEEDGKEAGGAKGAEEAGMDVPEQA
mmetsp:Transcript_9789/g.23270  ORF Transcript_9789/g.23270 Transcript_9789/m.23270 type:complete len:216 (+) Transcript_9789:29-676(+)